MTNDVNAIVRIMEQALGKWLATGKVASVSSSSAIVNLGSEVNTQTCSYDPSSPIAAGDTVILIKPPRSPQWSIVAVMYRTAQGLSNNTRETPNNRAGGQSFSKGNTYGGGSAQTLSSASVVLVNSQTITFRGGRPRVTYNGFATIASGSSLLQMFVGYDGIQNTCLNANIGTAATPINFSWTSPTPLNGPHSIEVYALRSSANISLTNYQFQVDEI